MNIKLTNAEVDLLRQALLMAHQNEVSVAFHLGIKAPYGEYMVLRNRITDEQFDQYYGNHNHNPSADVSPKRL